MTAFKDRKEMISFADDIRCILNNKDHGNHKELLRALSNLGFVPRSTPITINARVGAILGGRLDDDEPDDELESLVAVLNENGYVKRKHGKNFIEAVDDVLHRKVSDPTKAQIVAILRKHGYVHPLTAEDPVVFGRRVADAIGNCDNMYHQAVKEAIAAKGYSLPRAVPPSDLRLDLSTLPEDLQELFKVFTDCMLGGLQKAERRLEFGDWLTTWKDKEFTPEVALATLMRNIVHGHYADVANFAMFMSGRGMTFNGDNMHAAVEKSCPTINGGGIPPIPPIPRKGTKKPKPMPTSGRQIDDSFRKDQLEEGKLHWIVAVDGYDELFEILAAAYDQAARGKGVERHGNGLPFMQQPIMKLTEAFGTGFPLGQAAKKLEESTGMSFGPDCKELLGAIVYTAAAIIGLEKEAASNAADEEEPI